VWRLALAACALVGATAFALLVTRNAAEPVASPVAPTPSTEAHIVVMGLHGKTSDPFFLDGGSYRTVWSAWGESPSDPPCTHSVALMAVDPADDSGDTSLASHIQVPSTGVTEEIDLSDVAPGDYYFEVTSACAWQIELSPR
jgi:hypothetical protein